MPIIFEVKRSVEGIGALAGDLIVVDPDDAEYPVSLVRAKPKAELVTVLRHLDAFRLLSPPAALSTLFAAVGLEPPRHAHGQPDGEPAVPRAEEAS